MQSTAPHRDHRDLSNLGAKQMRKSISSALALASVSTLALMTSAHAGGPRLPQAPHLPTPAPITTVVAGNGVGNGNGNLGGYNGNGNGNTTIFGQ